MRSSYYYGWVLVGVADFNVSNLIKNWLNIEPRFFRYLKKKQDIDRKYLDYWIKRDFYVEYMCKKYEKMELMNREGILHARDLDYAEIRKKVVDSLKPLAELPFISMHRLRNNIKSKVESEFRRKKMPLSILGRDMEFERILGILEMYRSAAEIDINIKSILGKLQKNKITKQEYNQIMKVLQDAKAEIKNEIVSIEEQLSRLVKLSNKYHDHLKRK